MWSGCSRSEKGYSRRAAVRESVEGGTRPLIQNRGKITSIRYVWFPAALFMALAITSSGAVAKVVNTPIGSPRTVTVGDLLGRTPQEVQAILTPQAKGWPIIFALEAEAGSDHWAAAQARDLLQDPATVESMARFRQHADIRLLSQTSCKLATASGDPAPFTLLMFVNDRLSSVWDGNPTRAVDPAGLSAEEVFRRDGRTRLSPGEQRVVSCERTTFEPSPYSGGKPPGDTAGSLQGLALLPLAVTLPGLNAHRITASHSGTELYDRLAPGTAVPSDLNGVRRFEGFPEQGSETLVVDLGGYTGRNLTNFDDHGIVGVRAGRVVWRALSWTGAALAPTSPSH